MKRKIIVSLLLLLLTINSYTQDLPKGAKAGECFLKCTDESSKTGYTEWMKVDCDIVKNTTKQKEYVLDLQNKMIQDGFDVKATGKLDYKTAHYYNNYKKLLSKKRRLR